MAPPAKKQKNLCKFRSDYTAEYPTIVVSTKKGPSFAHCTACNSDFSISSGGRYDIKVHVGSKRHRDNSSSDNVAPISSFFSKNKEEEAFKNKVTYAEVLFVFFLIEHNLPMSVADHAGALFKRMFPDSKIAEQYACGRTKSTAVTKSLAQHFTDDLVGKLQRGPFSLSTDGSNDGGSAQIYPLVVRFFDHIKGAVVTQLLSIVECDGPSTGENIFNMLDKEFKRLSIPWKNVTSFCCDNASVMMGIHKGVAKFVLDHNPAVFINGCACHLLHLAAKAGSKQLHKDIEGILVDIYFFMDKSTKRQKQFSKFQKECGVNLNKILKHGATRWLSLESCVSRLIDQWEPLSLFFESEFSSLSESQQKSSKSERVRRVAKFFSDPTSRLYCLFLRDSLPIFNSCNLLLQRDSPQIHVVQHRLHNLFTDILIRFVKTSAISKCSNIFEIEHSSRKCQLPREELKIGSAARDHLNELKASNKITTSDEDGFVKDVRNFYSHSLAYIIAKFPLNDEVLQNAQVLDVRQRANAKEASVAFFAKRFGFIPNEKQDDLLLEFARYKLEPLTTSILEEPDVAKQWHAIGALENLDRVKKFPLLFEAMMSVLCIPHSNADSERIFSMVRKNHTESRSSMSTQTLSALMAMKCHMLSRDWKCHGVQIDDALLRTAKGATMLMLQQ